MARLKHPNISPFYEWLDHDEIRDVVHRTLNMPPGERLVLIKGLVPGLVDALGVDEVEDFLDELTTKAHRYDEARRHPGEGRNERRTPGERIGGPTPEGHVHASEARDPGRPGGRNAEREMERELWRDARTGRAGRVKRIAAPVAVGLAGVAIAGLLAAALGITGGGSRGPRGPGGPRGLGAAQKKRRPGRHRRRSASTAEMDTALANRYDRYAG